MSLTKKVISDFDGLLPETMPGYQRRDDQVELAREIAEAMDAQETLIAEAETGIGKTLAYLVPSMRSEQKIVISTHTRALQDQLMFRDVPTLLKAMNRRRDIALLKGRSNYLCPQRMKQAISAPQLEMWARRPLLRIVEWADKSRDGDLAALPFDPFEKGVGSMVTATADQCLGSKCPEWTSCPLMKARQRASDADIVITNHSLLLADAALKSGEFGEILPEFDVYLLDEAHSLPQLASQHFGLQLQLRRFTQWHHDMQTALDVSGDEATLKLELSQQLKAVLDCWQEDNANLTAVADAWKPLSDMAASRSNRNEDLERLAARAKEISGDISAIQQPAEGYVAWVEGRGEFRRHQLAPVETGPVLQQHVWIRSAAFILLSATLRLSGSFAYARRRLGLDAEMAKDSFHPSPFDYARQAMTYIPRHLPAPGSDAGTAALIDEIESLLKHSMGRAFVLFTSHYMLRRVAPELAERLPWPVLEQGKSGSKDKILQQFREDTHSVLCGTRSFWEGVDVPGNALSMVIVDKVPFSPPNDPLLKARIRHCEQQGGDGFRDIQLPEAIAVLRQGVGRLIRSSEDRGVMAILDSRLYHKGYGREVVRNLPPAPVTAEIDAVATFFK
ncbi:MAG: ATP-dependent DNA helicase [Mariprofundaceae bacterium]